MQQGQKQTIKTDTGFVKYAHEWIYSSASNYQELESIIEIERISQRLITY